jgi:hypothetical protein
MKFISAHASGLSTLPDLDLLACRMGLLNFLVVVVVSSSEEDSSSDDPNCALANAAKNRTANKMRNLKFILFRYCF